MTCRPTHLLGLLMEYVPYVYGLGNLKLHSTVRTDWPTPAFSDATRQAEAGGGLSSALSLKKAKDSNRVTCFGASELN
jgi:hypothetical protein